MPIYEYLCQHCGERLETMQKVQEAPVTDCPACGQPQLRKLMSAAAVHTGDAKAVRGATAPSCGTGACPACLPNH